MTKEIEIHSRSFALNKARGDGWRALYRVTYPVPTLAKYVVCIAQQKTKRVAIMIMATPTPVVPQPGKDFLHGGLPLFCCILW